MWLFIYLEVPIDEPSKSIPSPYILLIESGNISHEMSQHFTFANVNFET